MIGAAWRLAVRGLRGGRGGWFTIIACLALGVGAIAASLSLDQSLRQALSDDARALLGGDAELRLTYRPPNQDELSFLQPFGQLSQSTEMRVMARDIAKSRQTLAEIKAVDGAYPLFGKIDLASKGELQPLLGEENGVWGAVAEQDLLDRLNLKPGDHLTIGNAELVLKDVILREPDRASANFSLGPRLLLAPGALAASGLIQPGSLVHHLVLVKLAKSDLDAFHRALDEKYSPPPWLYRDSREATPSLKRLLDRTTLFLTLVGLTSLLVGGIGIADGTTAFVEARLLDIARLKCLGAANRLILLSMAMQFAVLASAGLVIGLALGAAAPYAAIAWLGDRLPVAARLGFEGEALLKAALFGILACFTFAATPLARAAAVPGGQLLRNVVAPVKLPFSWPRSLIVGGSAAALGGLAVLISADHKLALWFVIGGALSFALFAGGGKAVVAAAKALASRLGGGKLALRLALSSLHRPGAPTEGVVLSLGLGLSLLVGLSLIEVTLSRQIDEQLPARAPSFFFIDIQPDQAAQFDKLAFQAGADQISRAVMIRGRITAINDVPIGRAKVANDAAWAVKGDRGLTVAAEPPADANIVAGSWWAKDYDGPPLVSLDANIARGFGVGLGDSITVDVLGRPITAKIASLRRIDWASLGMNFTFVLSPNALAGAPVSEIATVHAPADKLAGLERAVGDALPTISVIRIADALAQLRRVVDGIGLAIRAAAAVALVAGLLVLTAAIAAGQRRRINEAVLLKVLGAARADLLGAVLWEFLLVGLSASAAAALVGWGIAWGVLTKVLKLDAVLLPLPVLLTLGAGIAAVTLFGLLGTWRALEARPAPYLRSE